MGETRRGSRRSRAGCRSGWRRRGRSCIRPRRCRTCRSGAPCATRLMEPSGFTARRVAGGAGRGRHGRRDRDVAGGRHAVAGGAGERGRVRPERRGVRAGDAGEVEVAVAVGGGAAERAGHVGGRRAARPGEHAERDALRRGVRWRGRSRRGPRGTRSRPSAASGPRRRSGSCGRGARPRPRAGRRSWRPGAWSGSSRRCRRGWPRGPCRRGSRCSPGPRRRPGCSCDRRWGR